MKKEVIRVIIKNINLNFCIDRNYNNYFDCRNNEVDNKTSNRVI